MEGPMIESSHVAALVPFTDDVAKVFDLVKSFPIVAIGEASHGTNGDALGLCTPPPCSILIFHHLVNQNSIVTAAILPKS